MSSIKKVRLFENEVMDVLKVLSGIREATAEKVKNGSVKVEILTTDNRKALLQIWFKRDGATIKYALGKNPQVSEKIARRIADRCGQLQSVCQVFTDVSREKLEELIKKLESEGIKVRREEKILGDYFSLTWHSGQTLSMNYYPGNKKLTVSGKRNQIYERVKGYIEQGSPQNSSCVSRKGDRIYEKIKECSQKSEP